MLTPFSIDIGKVSGIFSNTSELNFVYAVTAYSTGTLSAGIHTFYAAASSSCTTSERTAFTVNVSECTSVGDGVQETSLWVVPNPSHGTFRIHINNMQKDVRYSDYDLSGKEVLYGEPEDEPVVHTGLAPGLYIIRLFQGDALRCVSRIAIIEN